LAFQVLVTSIGLWAGLTAMGMAWDRHLRRIASVATFTCGVLLVQSLMPLVARTL
jgi:hypothetical protein